MVHVARLVIVAVIHKNHILTLAPFAMGAVDIVGLNPEVEHATGREVGHHVVLVGNARDEARVGASLFVGCTQLGIIKLSSINLDALEQGETALAGNFHLLQLVAIEHSNILGHRRTTGGSKLDAINTGRNRKLGTAVVHG